MGFEDSAHPARTMSAVSVSDVAFRYGAHQALAGVSFEVPAGQIFGLLGPNGGGKTTLFRLLATLLPPQSGQINIAGLDVARQPEQVRRQIGVTFQSPSLDNKLTVRENLVHQGHLYGLSGAGLSRRIDELLEALALGDRRRDLAGALSGGLKRRVEIAKSLLHRPAVLLLDEPSTGLDPGARHDLWRYLTGLRTSAKTTILVTTHLMEEAEHADSLGILDRGQLVALGTPDELRQTVGGDCLTIQTLDPDGLAVQIREHFSIEPRRLGDALRVEAPAAHELLRDLVAAFPAEITAISLARPTLEDVFIVRTGHRFWEG